jgi:hypothetical protein
MHLCVMGIDFAYFYNVSIGLWNRPSSVICFFPILILINSVYSFYFNMNKQRSTKHTYKTKDRVTPLKTGGELRCSGRVGSSCSTSDTLRVNLVTNPVISHERGKDRRVFTTSGTYSWSIVTQIFHNDHDCLWFDRDANQTMIEGCY